MMYFYINNPMTNWFTFKASCMSLIKAWQTENGYSFVNGMPEALSVLRYIV
jgi:hypothetical protein